MCWIKEKRVEPIRDGNNRDPSRGSLDVQVCLGNFEKCILYKQLELATKGDRGAGKVRVVILGGATGGMGSSLILHLTKKIESHFPGLRIDLVILGTYFQIPPLRSSEQQKDKSNDIGNTNDSFHRVAAQIRELKEYLVDCYPKSLWRVYYAAITELDDTCGDFNKNGANPRASHLLELIAALAAFKLKDEEKGGFYQTAIRFDKDIIDWNEKIPYIDKLKKPAQDLMFLFGIIVFRIIPRFTLREGKEEETEDLKRMERDQYVKLYIKKPKDTKEQERVRKVHGEFIKIRDNLFPYFNLWFEIQEKTEFGMGKKIVEFFSRTEMDRLFKILRPEEYKILRPGEGDEKEPVMTNEILLYQQTWSNFFDSIKTDKTKLIKALEKDNVKDLVQSMIEDVYKVIEARKEG